MKRIFSTILIFTLFICSLTACSEMGKELTVTQTVSSEISEEMPATEHSNSNEDIVITAEYAPEGFVANGDEYIVFSVSDEDLTKVLFKTNVAVGNVRFLAIEWGEDFADSGEYVVSEVLYTIDVLAPDEVFVADTYFIDVAHARALSYLDKNGKTHYYGLGTSAVDGSLEFYEITVKE